MRNFLLLPIVMLSFVFLSCEKDDEISANQDNEALTEAQEQILANFTGPSKVNANTVILPNDMTLEDFLKKYDISFYDNWLRSADPFEDLGPQAAKNLLIGRLTSVAVNLTNRSKYQYENEGENKPKQNGLAYGFGNKDYKVRRAGIKSNALGGVCTEDVYGLDCSGFIYQLFKQSGVTIGQGADHQRTPKNLEQAIKSSIPALNKIKVEDIGQIGDLEMRSGDIVYWKGENGLAQHIGIILAMRGGLLVFQSNGYKAPKMNCELNLLPNRGPRYFSANAAKINTFGRDWSIVRINTDISGKHDLYFRCDNNTTQDIIFNLDFPTNTSNKFSVKGKGIDADKEPVNCEATLTYDNVSNILSGNIHTTKPSAPGFYRNDSFSIKLVSDDTGYFKMILGTNVDAICNAEGRLKSKE